MNAARIFIILPFLIWPFCAHGQTGSSKSVSQLTSEINSSFPSGTGGITAFNLRQVTLDMINSSVGGSVSPLQAPYNAKCDGSTDDTAAINSALSANPFVVLPPVNCFSKTGIIIPPGHSFVGLSFSAGNPPNSNSTVSQISCPNTIVCVQLGNSSTNDTALLTRISIVGSSGTPSGGSTCVLIQGYNMVMEDVSCFNFDYAYHWEAGCTIGISSQAARLYSGSIRVSHLWQDGWPEIKINESRFGENGSGDISGADYIRISGGCASNPAAAPNTLYVVNSQFNHGGAAAGNFLNFVNLTSPGVPTLDAGEFFFTNVHVENVSGNIVSSDSSWNIIRRLYFAQCLLSTSGNFWGLNAATNLSDLRITNSLLVGTFTIASANAVGGTIVNSSIASNAAFQGSTFPVSIIGNQFYGTVAYSGSWMELTRSGNGYFGAVTDTVSVASGGNYLVLDTGYTNTPDGHIFLAQGNYSSVPVNVNVSNLNSSGQAIFNVGNDAAGNKFNIAVNGSANSSGNGINSSTITTGQGLYLTSGAGPINLTSGSGPIEFFPQSFVGINTASILTAGDLLSISGSSNGRQGMTLTNGSTGASAQTVLTMGDNSSGLSGQIIVNGGNNSSGNGANTMTVVAQNGLFISGSSGNAFQVSSTGAVTLYNQPATGAITYAVCAAANANGSGGGALILDTSGTVCGLSSKRFKDEIGSVSFEEAALGVEKLHPGVWTYKDKKNLNGKVHVSLYAEDVEKMDPRCVIKGTDGKIRNYEDRCVLAYLTAIVKHQQREISNLKRNHLVLR